MAENETKQCQNCQKDFVIEPDDFDFYAKIKVPSPTFCPECRLIRRIIFRNERFLYKRKDSRTGELIFSTIPKTAPVKVYERDYWWSDNWNSMEYGRAYDWDKPFLEQFIMLSREVPWFSRSVINLVNSDYSANASDLKNCYLIFNSNRNEDCAYGVAVHQSKDCLDNYALDLSELCHQCFMVKNSYRTFFSSHCQNCQGVYFSQDLDNCQDCFACCNLRNKKYHIFNKPFSKEEYFEKLKEFDIGFYKNKEELQKKANDFWLKFPYKFIHGIKNANIGGDYISYSKNVFDSFLINGAEDCRHCVNLDSASTRDCYDYCSFGHNAELVYDSAQVGLGVSRLKFCLLCYPDCRDLQYCLMCHFSSDLFGCVGLRNKQYCILNKQYSKEEYEQLVPKIIAHMNSMPYISKKTRTPLLISPLDKGGEGGGIIYKYGEFFPPELSPFCYNETIAQEYFPLTKDQALEQGYNWKDPEPRNYQIDLTTDQLPDHIKDVKDDIVGKVIECTNAKSKMFENLRIENSLKIENCKLKIDSNPEYTNCTTAFKLIEPELQFYRKMNLPLPRLCPNCRHYQRLKQRNPLKLWKRQCQCAGDKSANGVYKNTIAHNHGNQLHPVVSPQGFTTGACPNTFETSYAPDRPEIVYCEACYLKEVV